MIEIDSVLNLTNGPQIRMVRVFCIYCKNVIETLLDNNQVCENCAEMLKVPRAKLFNSVFILQDEADALIKIENLLGEKIYFKGLYGITTNEFEVNDDHSVISLKLNFNNITDLPDTFNEFPNLSELKITSRSLVTISENFFPPNLTDLSFFSCNFESIPEALFNCNSLKNLWIAGTKVQEIPEQIAKLHNLETLKLNNNKIKDIHFNLGRLTNLSVLDLGCNLIREFPSSILKLQMLTILKLHVNYIRKLPKELLQLEHLEILEMYCNFIEKIPKLPANLQYLDISSNFNLELSDNLEEFQNLKLLNIGGDTKVDIKQIKKVIKESSLVTKLNPLSPNNHLLK